MTGVVIFNVTAFRAAYPAFSNVTAFPSLTLQAYFDTATAYIANQRSCQGMTVAQLTLALNLMTAHLAQLSVLIAKGQTPGMVQQAQIDKVNVSLTPPPVPNQFQWWLGLTAYGQQLLALLQIVGTGGIYAGGRPVVGSFRGFSRLW